MNVKVGTLIRNLDTGQAYPVFMVNTMGIFIVNCYSTETPTPIMVILPRDFSHWKEDDYMTEKKIREYAPINEAFIEVEKNHEMMKYYQACL